MWFGEVVGQSWLQIEELTLAFVLSALIGSSAKSDTKAQGCEPTRSLDLQPR
jgi:hypothetical protein